MAVERQGHGKSDRPNGKTDVEYQASLLHQVLSSLRVERPVLVGHSWGEIPLMLAGSVLGRHILKGILKQAFSPQPLPEKYFRMVNSSWLGRKQLKAYLDDESSLNASLRKLSTRYSEISVPVVILTGDQDQIVSAKENAYRLKNSIANSPINRAEGYGP
jgi:pimeloyl-ACP methyl ester carboxylesterase